MNDQDRQRGFESTAPNHLQQQPPWRGAKRENVLPSGQGIQDAIPYVKGPSSRSLAASTSFHQVASWFQQYEIVLQYYHDLNTSSHASNYVQPQPLLQPPHPTRVLQQHVSGQHPRDLQFAGTGLAQGQYMGPAGPHPARQVATDQSCHYEPHPVVTQGRQSPIAPAGSPPHRPQIRPVSTAHHVSNTNRSSELRNLNTAYRQASHPNENIQNRPNNGHIYGYGYGTPVAGRPTPAATSVRAPPPPASSDSARWNDSQALAPNGNNQFRLSRAQYNRVPGACRNVPAAISVGASPGVGFSNPHRHGIFATPSPTDSHFSPANNIQYDDAPRHDGHIPTAGSVLASSRSVLPYPAGGNNVQTPVTFSPASRFEQNNAPFSVSPVPNFNPNQATSASSPVYDIRSSQATSTPSIVLPPTPVEKIQSPAQESTKTAQQEVFEPLKDDFGKLLEIYQNFDYGSEVLGVRPIDHDLATAYGEVLLTDAENRSDLDNELVRAYDEEYWGPLMDKSSEGKNSAQTGESGLKPKLEDIFRYIQKEKQAKTPESQQKAVPQAAGRTDGDGEDNSMSSRTQRPTLVHSSGKSLLPSIKEKEPKPNQRIDVEKTSTSSHRQRPKVVDGSDKPSLPPVHEQGDVSTSCPMQRPRLFRESSKTLLPLFQAREPESGQRMNVEQALPSSRAQRPTPVEGADRPLLPPIMATHHKFGQPERIEKTSPYIIHVGRPLLQSIEKDKPTSRLPQASNLADVNTMLKSTGVQPRSHVIAERKQPDTPQPRSQQVSTVTTPKDASTTQNVSNTQGLPPPGPRQKVIQEVRSTTKEDQPAKLSKRRSHPSNIDNPAPPKRAKRNTHPLVNFSQYNTVDELLALRDNLVEKKAEWVDKEEKGDAKSRATARNKRKRYERALDKCRDKIIDAGGVEHTLS